MSASLADGPLRRYDGTRGAPTLRRVQEPGEERSRAQGLARGVYLTE